jgi:hypothetical protein
VPVVPKPIVPAIIPVPVVPKPITPKPAAPKPVEPVPPAPRPLEPAQPNLGSGLQCKRAPGDACSNVAPYDDAELETVRAKGRDAQASLLETQRANPLPQDINRATVSTKYEHVVAPNSAPPISPDETGFLGQDGLQVSFSTGSTWTISTTRNQAGVNPKMDNNILETYINPKDRGIVIMDSRNKENDLSAPQDKLPWSDMVMFDFRTAFQTAGVNPNELRYMIRSNIDGASSADKTQEYIEGAIVRTAGDRAKVNTFRSDPNASGVTTNELAAYQLLAGSDHVHRVLLMLKDYPTTMKNVRIESLSVTTPATKDATDEYSIIIKFAKIENL